MTMPSESAVRGALAQLDGSTTSAVALLSGMPSAELDRLGGFDEEIA